MARTDDPIIDEIRQYRDECAKKFDYDVLLMADYFRKRAEEAGVLSVRRPPRKPISSAALPDA